MSVNASQTAAAPSAGNSVWLSAVAGNRAIPRVQRDYDYAVLLAQQIAERLGEPAALRMLRTCTMNELFQARLSLLPVLTDSLEDARPIGNDSVRYHGPGDRQLHDSLLPQAVYALLDILPQYCEEEKTEVRKLVSTAVERSDYDAALQNDLFRELACAWGANDFKFRLSRLTGFKFQLGDDGSQKRKRDGVKGQGSRSALRMLFSQVLKLRGDTALLTAGNARARNFVFRKLDDLVYISPDRNRARAHVESIKCIFGDGGLRTRKELAEMWRCSSSDVANRLDTSIYLVADLAKKFHAGQEDPIPQVDVEKCMQLFSLAVTTRNLALLKQPEILKPNADAVEEVQA